MSKKIVSVPPWEELIDRFRVDQRRLFVDKFCLKNPEFDKVLSKFTKAWDIYIKGAKSSKTK